jgi:2-polyprenyl-3-methyl-5-hydroxy-6-metoxy-1,4-benzoquinol methylase
MNMKNNDKKHVYEVKELYSSFPYPNYPIKKKEDFYKTIIYQTVYFLSKRYIDTYKNKKITVLDAGCGTGELSAGLSHLNCYIDAIDRNIKSLEVAKNRAKKYSIKNISYHKFDLISDKLPNKYYDFIFSIGVIHHIPNTEKIFEKLMLSLKPGGFIILGLYNPYGMMRKRIERQILKLIVGNDINKRLDLAKHIYFKRPLSINETIWAADTYAQPFQQYFSAQEVIRWFEKNSIEFLESEPPLSLWHNKKLVLAILKSVLQNNKIDIVTAWQKTLLEYDIPIKPNNLEIFFTQFVWMLLGFMFGRGEFVNYVGQKKIDVRGK